MSIGYIGLTKIDELRVQDMGINLIARGDGQRGETSENDET